MLLKILHLLLLLIHSNAALNIEFVDLEFLWVILIMLDRYVAHRLPNGLLSQLLLGLLITIRNLAASMMSGINAVRSAAGGGCHVTISLESLVTDQLLGALWRIIQTNFRRVRIHLALGGDVFEIIARL